MPGIVLLLLVSSMVAGIGLLWAGLRGRRLNDHPVCRWCSFDLEGVYPEGVTCPECGAGLKRDNAVRIGVRRRMPVLVLVGALLAAVPLAPIATVGYALLTGSNIDSYKPLGLLLWESRYSDAGRLDAIATELQNRAMAGKLDPSQYAAVVDAVLDFQGDTSRPWAESWGDLIERARLDGALSATQEERFLSQAAVLELDARSTVQAGSTTPVRVKLKEARVGSNMALDCSVKVTGVNVDGHEASWRTNRRSRVDSFFGGMTGDPEEVASLTLQGKGGAGPRLAFFGPLNRPTGEVIIEIPSQTAPGDRTLELALDMSVGGSQSGVLRTFTIANGMLRSATPSAGASSSTVSTSKRIRVVGPDDPVVTPIDADSDTTRKLAEALTPQSVMLGGDLFGGFVITRNGFEQPASGDASVQFDLAGVDTPVAFDVYCRADGHEWKLGELHSGSRVDETGGGAFQMSSTIIINGKVVQQSSSSSKDSRTVSGSWEGGDAEKVDIILKPSSDVAARTMDLDRYYAGAVEFKDVPVIRTADSMADPFADMERRMRQRLTPFGDPFSNGPRQRQPAKPEPPKPSPTDPL